MHRAFTPLQPSKRPARSRLAGAFPPSPLNTHPFSSPLYPHTPSLPGPEPANDTTRNEQIPFRSGLGLLLKDDGEGGLLPVAPLVSGIAPGGCQKAVAAEDGNDDGKSDIVVTRISGITVVLERQRPLTP